MKKVVSILSAVAVAFGTVAFANVPNRDENTQVTETGKEVSVIQQSENGITYMDIFAFDETFEIEDTAKQDELFECIEKDIENLTEEQMYNNAWRFCIGIGFGGERQDEYIGRYIPRDYDNYALIDVNANYHNTIEWMKENGYWEDIKIGNDGPVLIMESPYYLPFMDFWDKEIDLSNEEFIKIFEGEDAERVCEYVQTAEATADYRGTKYIVYQLTGEKSYKYLTRLIPGQYAELIK